MFKNLGWRRLRGVAVLLAGTVVGLGTTDFEPIPPAIAEPVPSPPLELPGGISFFASPPQLAESWTSYDGVSIPAAKYYFTIALPESAGNPLARVLILQLPSPDSVDFIPSQTQTFLGDRQKRDQTLLLSSTWDGETGQLWVNFTSPVAPGSTITIQAKPVQNPDLSGVYLYRVYAYPPGDNGQRMDLGVARFQFYRDIP